MFKRINDDYVVDTYIEEMIDTYWNVAQHYFKYADDSYIYKPYIEPIDSVSVELDTRIKYIHPKVSTLEYQQEKLLFERRIIERNEVGHEKIDSALFNHKTTTNQSSSVKPRPISSTVTQNRTESFRSTQSTPKPRNVLSRIGTQRSISKTKIDAYRQAEAKVNRRHISSNHK